MLKMAKRVIAVCFAASLFLACSNLLDEGGGKKNKLITREELAGTEVQPGQAEGIPTWDQLKGKHEMDVFVLMADIGSTSITGYDAKWEDDGTASYHQNATFIKNPDGKTFKILLDEAQFGAMPLAPVVVFPKVTFAVREDKTVTFKSLENGFAGFVALDPDTSQSPITEDDWNDIEKIKPKTQVWGNTSSIRSEYSEVRIEDGKLVCKIDVQWNLNRETITAVNEEWKLPFYAAMYENVKSASATKGKYRGVFDKKTHGTLESGGILEVVRVNNETGRFVGLPMMNAVRNLSPCEPVTVEVPADAQAVTAEQLAALPFLGSPSCLHSRGVSRGKIKTLKNETAGLASGLYENTVSWNFAAGSDSLVVTSEGFKIGKMPYAGTMKITVPLTAIKKSGTVYYFDSFNSAVDESRYTVSGFGITRTAPLTSVKAAFDTANNSWLFYAQIVGTIHMIIPTKVNMEVHSRGTDLNI